MLDSHGTVPVRLMALYPRWIKEISDLGSTHRCLGDAKNRRFWNVINGYLKI